MSVDLVPHKESIVLVMLPAHALGTAVNSMAGQNIGVSNWKRVHQITKYGLIYNFAVMGLIGILVVIFAEYGVKMFIQEMKRLHLQRHIYGLWHYVFRF